VARGQVLPRSFTVRTLPERVARVGDLWSDMKRRGRSLTRAQVNLKKMTTIAETK
jgi:DNA primase